MRTFYVQSLGCKVNRVQSDMIAAALIARGACPAGRDDADLIVIDSCTVTGEADAKTRKAVRQAVRARAGRRIIVTGCAATIDPAGLSAIDSHVIVEADKARAADTAAALLGLAAADSPHTTLIRAGEGFRTRMDVMVQDGCDNACTYCIVHTARGKSISRPADEVVREVAEAALAGVREVVLTGINIGSYLARDGVPTNLVTLLERLLDETDIGRLRISSIEPLDVSTRLIDTVVSSRGRICAHLHLPLQSGCDRVLSEMDRPYTSAVYMKIIDQIRAKLPGVALTTDAIVGFPGEDESDFADTLDICRQAAFSKIHVFRYSMRAGTPAALRTDQVDPQVKRERGQRLRALGEQLARADARSRIGSVESVLVEGDGTGKSESYHDVRFLREPCEHGQLVPMRLASLDADGAFEGVLLENR